MLKIWDSTLVKWNGSKERHENQVKLMKKSKKRLNMRESWIPVHYFEISNWRHVKNEEKCKWMKNNTSLRNFEVRDIHLKVGRNDKNYHKRWIWKFWIEQGQFEIITPSSKSLNSTQNQGSLVWNYFRYFNIWQFLCTFWIIFLIYFEKSDQYKGVIFHFRFAVYMLVRNDRLLHSSS